MSSINGAKDVVDIAAMAERRGIKHVADGNRVGTLAVVTVVTKFFFERFFTVSAKGCTLDDSRDRK